MKNPFKKSLEVPPFARYKLKTSEELKEQYDRELAGRPSPLVTRKLDELVMDREGEQER